VARDRSARARTRVRDAADELPDKHPILGQLPLAQVALPDRTARRPRRSARGCRGRCREGPRAAWCARPRDRAESGFRTMIGSPRQVAFGRLKAAGPPGVGEG